MEWGFLAACLALLLCSMHALNHRYQRDPRYRAFIRRQRRK